MINLLEKSIALAERFPLPVLQFLFRFSIGYEFWNSGLGKIQSWQPTIALFTNEFRVPVLPPEVAATLAATVELTCPPLLFFGLATRLATLPMLGVVFVIQTFVYPDLWHIHLMWATILVYILTQGPGPISLDHYIAKSYQRRAHA